MRLSVCNPSINTFVHFFYQIICSSDGRSFCLCVYLLYSLCFCLFVSLYITPVCLCICPFFYQIVCPSDGQSVCLSYCLCVYLLYSLSFCAFVCLYITTVCLRFCSFFYQIICLLMVNLSVCLIVCVCLLYSLSFCPIICLYITSVCLCICPFFYQIVCPSDGRSFCLFVYLLYSVSFCLFVCLYVTFVCLCVCPYRIEDSNLNFQCHSIDWSLRDDDLQHDLGRHDHLQHHLHHLPLRLQPGPCQFLFHH
jgi:hypothetical protein